MRSQIGACLIFSVKMHLTCFLLMRHLPASHPRYVGRKRGQSTFINALLGRKDDLLAADGRVPNSGSLHDSGGRNLGFSKPFNFQQSAPHVACTLTIFQRVGKVCAHQNSLFLLLVATLVGCASSPKQDWNVGSLERGQTYIESRGAASGKARISRILPVDGKKESVRWGGVASALQNGTPIAPLASEKLAKFQEVLVREIKNTTNVLGFKLVGVNETAPDNQEASESGLILMILLQHERTTELKLSDEVKTSYELLGQLIFLDTKAAMQVTASYPLGVVVSDLGNANVSALIETALFSTRNADDGKPLGLVGQIMDFIQNEAVVPRALFPPVRVMPVEMAGLDNKFRISTLVGKKRSTNEVELGQEEVGRWSDELGRSLCSFLGANSGLPLNPFTSSGNTGRLTDDSTLSQAVALTMRTADNQMIMGKLTPPRYNIVMTINSLSCSEVEESAKRQTYQTTMNYGLESVIYLKNADTGKTVAAVGIRVDKGGKHLGLLAKRYQTLTEYKFRRKGAGEDVRIEEIKTNLRSFLDELLLQLAREIAFTEEDVLKNFEDFRKLIKRNA